MTTQTLFAAAEVDYRLDRATAQFPHHAGLRRRAPRRLRVRRRPTLHLPRPLPAV